MKAVIIRIYSMRCSAIVCFLIIFRMYWSVSNWMKKKLLNNLSIQISSNWYMWTNSGYLYWMYVVYGIRWYSFLCRSRVMPAHHVTFNGLLNYRYLQSLLNIANDTSRNTMLLRMAKCEFTVTWRGGITSNSPRISLYVILYMNIKVWYAIARGK